jgi:hypothetical protein
MNKRQSNKLNSYQSVKGVLENNKAIYEPIPIISQSVENFLDVVNEIDDIATKTEMDTTGETSAKIVAKEKLATVASSLAASAAVFAFEHSDVELEASVAYTYSDIRYARDTESLQMASAIEAELLSNEAELVDYMVSPENLAELHTLIAEFEDAMETKGGVKSGSVAETRKLAILFRVADDMLSKRLDRFVARLKTDHQTFYDAYNNARMIVDL